MALLRLAATGLAVALVACTSATPTSPSPTPKPLATTSVGPAPTAVAIIGGWTFRESSGAFAIDYPETWQGGWQDHFELVNATPGMPKATFEIFPLGKQSYQIPPTAPTLSIATGFGTLTGYRFKAPDVYGGAPYYAEVIATRFHAGGRDWAVEAVVLELRREDTIAAMLGLLRTLRPT